MKKKITLIIISLFLLATQVSAQLSVTLSVSPNDTICQGQTVTFTATVTGCPPPFLVQWYNNGSPIAAATGLTLTWTNSIASTDCIMCTVISGSGTCIPNTASDAICLFVVPNQPPSVTITANPLTICLGSLDVITATAIDAGPCAVYTWWVDGVIDASSTNATLNYLPLTAGTHIIYCEVLSCDTCDNLPPVSNPQAQSNMLIINVVICTGVSEMKHNSSIKIYPNPTTGKINLYWENPFGIECKIFISDCIGKTISEYSTDKNSLSVEDAELKSGVYFVTIKSGERIYRSPVIIY